MMETGRFFINRRFHDFDELAEAVREWRLDFRQLDRGHFRADLLQVGSGKVLLTRASFNRSLEHWGIPPAALRTITLPADPSYRFTWRGHDTNGKNVLVFPPGGQLESVTPPGFDVFHISAPDEYFVEIGHTVGLPELPDLIGSSEVVTVGSASIAKLRRSLRSFCKQILTSPSKLEDPELRHKLDVDIPGQLLQTLASSLPEFRKPPTRTRDKALRQAQEYIMEFSDEPLTVRDLCRATQVSERTLEYAFLERFHLSPKAYLRNHRLNCVRKELRKVDPFSTKIADVANNWAFWHMGQFAADYRKLFGELPSQTLLVSTAKQAP